MSHPQHSASPATFGSGNYLEDERALAVRDLTLLNRTLTYLSPPCAHHALSNADHDPQFVHAYANAVLDAWRGEDDKRPARALANYREHFAPHVAELRKEIIAWRQNPRLHKALTSLVWTVAERIQNRVGEGGPQALAAYDTKTRNFYLRFGAIELAKLICRQTDGGSARK